MTDRPWTDQVTTLESLLYGLRHTLGEIKDKVLIDLQTVDAPVKSSQTGNSEEQHTISPVNQTMRVDKPLPELIHSYELRKITNKGFLAEKQDKIYSLIKEILSDPLLTVRDPRLSEPENDERSGKYQTLARQVLSNSVTLANGMDFVGLVALGDLASKLYDTLKPVALESRFYDHKTGLRISDWLMNIMFDYLKDFIVNPTHHISIANIDLNNFSLSNGLVGKEQTDIVVAQFARLLKELPEGVAVRRTNERGDEFYVCFKSDAEGAKTIMQHKFVKPLEEKLMTYVQDASKTELAGGFNDAIQRYTCAIGITSTHIPEAPTIFQRAIKMLSGNGKDDLKRELAYLDETQPELRAKTYKGELTDIRRAILFTLRQVLVDESEKAMKAAKKKDHDNNTIFIYNPHLSPSSYSYETTIYRRKE